jgi:hypothetical protein
MKDDIGFALIVLAFMSPLIVLILAVALTSECG